MNTRRVALGVLWGLIGTWGLGQGTGGEILYRLSAPTAAELNRMPKNLAFWHMGTILEGGSEDRNVLMKTPDGVPEKSLMGEDPSAVYHLPAGLTEFAFDLDQPQVVEEFFFQNDSAAGTFSLWGSPMALDRDSDLWIPLAEAAELIPGRLALVEFPFTEVRHLRVEFNLAAPGQISPFGLTGDLPVSATSVAPPTYTEMVTILEQQGPLVEFNFAGISCGTRVVYISAGELAAAQSILDGSLKTAYDFAAGTRDWVAVIDLAHEVMYETVSLVLESGPGLLEVYSLAQFPELEASPGASPAGGGGIPVSLPANFFDRCVLLKSYPVPTATQRLRVEIGRQRGRYVVFRWMGAEVPGANPPSRLFELAVIGKVPPDRAYYGAYRPVEFSGPTVSPTVPPPPVPPPRIPSASP